MSVGQVENDCMNYNAGIEQEPNGNPYGEASWGYVGNQDHVLIQLNGYVEVWEHNTHDECDNTPPTLSFLGEYAEDDIHKAIKDNIKLSEVVPTL